jgi:phosphoribosyl-ATP pyrophosphohydrolase
MPIGRDPRRVLARALLHKAPIPMSYPKHKDQAVDLTPGVEPVTLDELTRLFAAISRCRRSGDGDTKTAKLFAAGLPKMAKKLVEEATEVAIEAVRGERRCLKSESADLLYHLVVIWNAVGIKPSDVWGEMKRRERLLGIAEKLPKRLTRS